MAGDTKVTRKRFVGVALGSLLWVCGAFAQDLAALDPDAALAAVQSVEIDTAQAHAEFRSLDEDVQSLKKEVLDLNRACNGSSRPPRLQARL